MTDQQAAVEAGRQKVLNCLTSLVDQLSPNHRVVGDFDSNHNLSRMPITDSDGRKRTWRKTAKDAAERVFNVVMDIEQDCWLVKPSSSEEFCIVKLSPTGTGNKWTLQRLLYCLRNPHSVAMSTHLGDHDPSTLSHRCGVSFPRIHACVNPYHTHSEAAAPNEDRKGCRYGSARLCSFVPSYPWLYLHK